MGNLPVVVRKLFATKLIRNYTKIWLAHFHEYILYPETVAVTYPYKLDDSITQKKNFNSLVSFGFLMDNKRRFVCA